MPRYCRFHVTGGLFHIISRFHDRRFYLDIDGAREKYLELLGKAAQTHDSRIVAYCLMSSHIHLVLQLANDSLGRLTKQIHAPFGIWLNKQRNGLGTIFADRPKSVLVHSDTYGAAVLRYVHNNPVRAGIVERASDSEWSSHRAYMGLEACPSWLATDAVFGRHEAERETIRKKFGLYVDEGRLEGRRSEFSGEVSMDLARRIRKLLGGDVEMSYPVLGPDEFVVSVLKEQVHQHGDRKSGTLRKITAKAVVRAVFESMSLNPEDAYSRTKIADVARARASAAWIWVERLGKSQVVFADELKLSPAAIAMMVGKLRRRGLDKGEKRLLDKILKSFSEKKQGNMLSDDATSETTRTEETGPKVIILKRQRI
jgi:putative transposase